MPGTFVIVGASLAGGKAAETLRDEGFDGRVILIGDEPRRPYERPPLSKGYLLGDDELDVAYLQDEAFYQAHDIELRLGDPVTRLDAAAHRVEAAGESIDFDKLLLATGARPRRLDVPGADAAELHYLRTMADSERLRAAFTAGARVVIIGAGWIGLECASAARAHDCQVTVLDPLGVPLAGVLGERVGQVFAVLHTEHGVDLRMGTSVVGVDSDGTVHTSTGDALPADVVVVGIGALPNQELAADAGLRTGNGILVDAGLATSHPDVYAAGDVALIDHPVVGRRVRVEHWANALGGGPAAARAMLGQSVSYQEMPFFYSDQYDLGMESAGLAAGHDQLVIRGDLESREFIAFYLADGRLIAGANVNVWDVTDDIQAIIRAGNRVDAARLADPQVPLTDLA